MEPNSDYEHNPYASHPTEERDKPFAVPAEATEMVKKFRSQIHALGVFWIVIGAITVGMGGMIFAGQGDFAKLDEAERAISGGIVVGMGMTWVVLGALSLLKQMWACYVALVLSYLSLVMQIVNLNICPLVILIVVVLQAHRVISWSGKLKANGIPLTAKP